MKSMSAKDAKNAFGRLIDSARAAPVTIEKHGRAVVVVLSVEEYERLSRTAWETKRKSTKGERND
jgi:prevent-host-death family protein